MEGNITKKGVWNEAGKAGLALGAASALYLFATQMLAKVEISALLSTIISGLLWIAKFGGCIWLMMAFMKKFADDNPEVDNRDTRKFGIITALLSAVFYAAITFADVAFISTDAYTEQINIVMSQFAQTMDSNTMAYMETVIQSLPQITFFSNLIYCFIYGTILSLILSASIPSKDPFAGYKPEEL